MHMLNVTEMITNMDCCAFSVLNRNNHVLLHAVRESRLDRRVINSLFIMCIGIIRDNSLVGRRSRAEAQTPDIEHITLYCT